MVNLFLLGKVAEADEKLREAASLLIQVESYANSAGKPELAKKAKDTWEQIFTYSSGEDRNPLSLPRLAQAIVDSES